MQKIFLYVRTREMVTERMDNKKHLGSIQSEAGVRGNVHYNDRYT